MSSQARFSPESSKLHGRERVSFSTELAELRHEVEQLKSEGWVKKWGGYLGLIGVLIASFKGGLDLAGQFWQHPHTSLAIPQITIFHDPGLSSEVVRFPVVVENSGNWDDVLLNHGASLSVADKTIELTEADFGLFDNGKKVGTSLLIPKYASRPYDVSITFTPKSRELALTPGLHRLELRFLGSRDKPYSASFCFPLQESDIRDLFEANEFRQQTMITQCPGKS